MTDLSLHADDDPYDLRRFVVAQENSYGNAIEELRKGRKRSHWMWFVFPQISGLGSSPTARHYAIRSTEEARAYLSHPVLGPRLSECTNILLRLDGLSASDVFGYPDDLKFCSSMTLFDFVSSGSSMFRAAIDKYCSGRLDQKTLQLIENR